MCMVLTVEVYEFVMKVFAPNRKNSSCQEMGRQYLKWCSMGNLWKKVQVLDFKFRFNYEGS